MAVSLAVDIHALLNVTIAEPLHAVAVFLVSHVVACVRVFVTRPAHDPFAVFHSIPEVTLVFRAVHVHQFAHPELQTFFPLTHLDVPTGLGEYPVSVLLVVS